MSNPLRVAMITEPTSWHRQKLIDALSADEIGEVAVADATGETFDEVRDGAGPKLQATYTDLDRMLQDFRPDAALVTLEPWRMPAAIKQSLEADVHVYHEKPGYVDIEDYREIYRLARSRNRHLCIAYLSRMIPVVQEARRIVSEGLLGDLFSFQAHFIADQERIRQDPADRFEYDHAAGGWFFSKEKGGGGHLTILGCHYLDMLRYVSGSDFTSVVAMCKNVGGEPITVEDAAALTIEFDNGMIGNLNSGFYTSKAEYASQRHSDITIWGRGRLAELQSERRGSRCAAAMGVAPGCPRQRAAQDGDLRRDRRHRRGLSVARPGLPPRVPGRRPVAPRAGGRTVGRRMHKGRLQGRRDRPHPAGGDSGGLAAGQLNRVAFAPGCETPIRSW